MSEKVRTMFSKIAGKYDLLNDLLSMGIHRLWRKKAVRAAGTSKGMKILDLATGTGDLAIEFHKAAGKEGSVTGVDFCEEMMISAPEKAREAGFDIEFLQGDAMDIKFPDNSFDISGIAFGIRNVDSPLQCLKEMSRVVRPGGTVMVLEFGQPKGLFALIYKIYSKTIIPLIGKIISRDNAAYTYLPETASKFPCREDFTNLMKQTGVMEDCRYISLSSGIAFIYTGKVKRMS